MKLEYIDIDEALRYMGQRMPSANVTELATDCAKLLVEQLEPKYVYREAKLVRKADGICLDGSDVVLTGNDICKHLENCSSAVLFAATLTAQADKIIRTAEATDITRAFVLDALCSAATEQACDMAESEIFAERPRVHRTYRFSPGYGDLPLELQKDILNYLNAQRRIGLTVTENFLMVPRKSVTAIIGISDSNISKGKNGCAECQMRNNCAFCDKK